MKRVALILAVISACAAGTARAQTGTTTAGDRAYVEATVGPTFGNKASVSFGGEVGWWLTRSIGIFGEGGRMQNVATGEFDNKAALIADYIGGSADAKRRVGYFDAGVVYRIPMTSRRLHPYVLVGVGGARVSNHVTFSVAGSDVTGSLLDAYGVQLGTDLSGSFTKVFVTAGAGTHVALTGRWIADVSYRYGYVGKDTDADGQVVVKSINTNRLQFGFGLKF